MRGLPEFAILIICDNFHSVQISTVYQWETERLARGKNSIISRLFQRLCGRGFSISSWRFYRKWQLARGFQVRLRSFSLILWYGIGVNTWQKWYITVFALSSFNRIRYGPRDRHVIIVESCIQNVLYSIYNTLFRCILFLVLCHLPRDSFCIN